MVQFSLRTSCMRGLVIVAILKAGVFEGRREGRPLVLAGRPQPSGRLGQAVRRG
jgi:hypothetical protein